MWDYLENSKSQKGWGMELVVEHLSCKCGALCSNLCTTKTNKQTNKKQAPAVFLLDSKTLVVNSFLFLFWDMLIIQSEGVRCDISMRAYDVLWSNLPHYSVLSLLPLPPILRLSHNFCGGFIMTFSYVCLTYCNHGLLPIPTSLHPSHWSLSKHSPICVHVFFLDLDSTYERKHAVFIWKIKGQFPLKAKPCWGDLPYLTPKFLYIHST
jgi:hypothetical protein